MILTGRRVVLRPAVPGDVERITEIRHEPEVLRRWGIPERGELEEFLGQPTTFVIEVGGQTIGAIQFHEEPDPMYRHAGIDLFLATSWHNQGLGSEAVAVLAAHLIRERGHHRLTIDPAADHTAAIRAYEKVGFKRIGVMRDYELGPDGTWHDGLLMDLLAGEFREPWGQ